MTKEVKGGSVNYVYMNEEKKYYVPEIKEFYIGFEYETDKPLIAGSLLPDGKWHKFFS